MPQDNKGLIEFSVVVPFYNEEDNAGLLHARLLSALAGYRYELVYVNDGSTDATRAKLREALASAPTRYAKIISLPKNLGQSFAFKAGLDNSRFPVVAFMDGDLQNDPADIPRLLHKLNDGYDLVQGVRYRRQDPFFSKIIPSVAANVLLRVLCGSKFRDIGCSLKAFKKRPGLGNGLSARDAQNFAAVFSSQRCKGNRNKGDPPQAGLRKDQIRSLQDPGGHIRDYKNKFFRKKFEPVFVYFRAFIFLGLFLRSY
jgi:glycosyltransferase involved in cell wall biosynthesis